MPYSTKQAVRNALAPGAWATPPAPGTVGKTNTAADLPDPQLDDAIAEADSTIDAAIGSYYVTPVAGIGDPAIIPHPIDFWSRDIAAYNATLTFRKNQTLDPRSPVALRYAQAISSLTSIQNGKATLSIPILTGDQSAGGSGDPINPYIGTMFGPSEFSLRGDTHLNPGYPDEIPWGRWYPDW